MHPRYIPRSRAPRSRKARSRTLEGAGLRRDSPITAAPCIARSIIRFTVNVIPDLDHEDTADTLEAMRHEHLVLAHAVHPRADAHQ